MKPIWTWGGTFFGFRTEDALYTHHGKHVGKFYDDEVYSSRGRYLGEIRNGRLITKTSGTSRVRASFTPRQKASRMKHVNYVGYVMLVGYQDFPKPTEF